ncbi:MAG: NAD-binding protein [Elainellaceae cyanobacterium]
MNPRSASGYIEPISQQSAHLPPESSIQGTQSEPQSRPAADSNHPPIKDQVIVCGLGSLGQHCVVQLKEFGVRVNAIEINLAKDWQIPSVLQLFDQVWEADCRQTEWLEKAGVRHCRAILFVTDNERANIEAAFAARLLNPKVRLVVRSAKHNLNELLSEQLGNFVAFEPTQLSAPAFALAALDERILGFFKLNDQLFQVIQHSIDPGHRWSGTRYVYELNNRMRRVLSHIPAAARSPQGDHRHHFQDFYVWEPSAKIEVGDILITIEASHGGATDWLPAEADGDVSEAPSWLSKRIGQVQTLTVAKAIAWVQRSMSAEHQLRRLALVCGLTVLLLLSVGTILFWRFYPNISLVDAFFATMVLLLGGYGDRFDDFGLDVPVPGWLRLFGLMLTLAGTAFVGVLYALLTEKLLTLRIMFLRRRLPIPERNHVVVIGLGRVGMRVVRLLRQLHQPIVGIKEEALDSELTLPIPVITGNINSALSQVNLSQAHSIVAVTDDEMENLEWGLRVHAANPHSRMVIRTYDQRFSDRIAQLFPYAQVLCASALSAEAFVAAAFGENVLSLFRLDQQTILVTEYTIEADDTLHDRLLADIAYGYEVLPLACWRAGQDLAKFMPSDDLRLHVGDRLVVLATIGGLKRIEKGETAPRRWQVRVEQAMTDHAIFDGATELALITGCGSEAARALMADLPATLSLRLYHHQAHRLVRKLRRTQVIAQVELASDSASQSAS